MHLYVLFVVLCVSKYLESKEPDFDESLLKGNNCDWYKDSAYPRWAQ